MDEDVYRYIREHSTQQSEALRWVEKQTNIRTNHARMLSGSVQGELPEDGHLDTLELNDELEDLIREGFERAGVSDRISLHIGDCKKTLLEFKNEVFRQYDMVFIDANKREYCDYYELVFPLVRPGGWILADNVLWDGKVCAETISQDRQTQGILAFNEMVAADPRVENVILPLRDGLSIIYKK